jgi:ketosteroid isomerase-like protein
MTDVTSDGRTVVHAFFHRLGEAGDVPGWLGLLADDIEVDTPFAPVGEPTRFSGIEAVARRFGDARARMATLVFTDLEVLATEDPERWVATCGSQGALPDGRAYANRYCWLFRVRDGRIRWWCEFFDPQAVLALRDGRPPLGR